MVVWSILRFDCPAALALLIFIGITDGADGFLARRYGWTSRFGEYLDPIADKILMTAAYVALAASNLAPWWLVWLVIGRDLVILGMAAAAFLLTRIREFPPTLLGKLSTMVQIVCGTGLLAICAAPGWFPPDWSRFLIWSTGAVTSASGADYVVRAGRMWARRNEF